MSLQPAKNAPSLASKVFAAAEAYGLENEALAALMKEIPAKVSAADTVFEVGEPWAGGQNMFVTLAWFEGPGDDRLGRYRPGDVRVYLVASEEARAGLAAAGTSPFLIATAGERRATRRFYDEDTFIDAMAREWASMFRALQAPFLDEDEDEDDDTECPECHAETRVWTRDDPNDEESELSQEDGAKHCGNCGAQIPIPAELAP